ncbi:hypothetical protein ACFQU2_09680 [Siccirubricoccus deserti]
MKFALHLSNIVFPDAAGAARLGQWAEAAGFDTVLAIDHVVLPEISPPATHTPPPARCRPVPPSHTPIP